MINKENIDISCNFTRLQYKLIDDFIASGKIGKVEVTDKFIIMFDMSYLLSMLEHVSKIEITSGFNDSELDNDIIMMLVYGILNSLGHYRNYIQTKLRLRTVVIVYSSDPEYYVKYSKTFGIVNKILNLFKKTIFIERMKDETKYLYQHMAYFTAMNVSNSNGLNNKRCRILYVGNNQLSSQLLRIDRDTINVKYKHIDSGLDIYFKENISESTDKLSVNNRSVDLITSMISILGFKHGFAKLKSVKNKRFESIYSTIFKNCMEFVDKDDYTTIVNDLNFSLQDTELFGSRLKSIDVDFHNKTYSLSKTLLKIWSSKLDTKSIHSFNDFVEYDGIKLNVNWLMG